MLEWTEASSIESACTELPESQSSVSSTHIGQLTSIVVTAHISNSRGSEAQGLHGYLQAHARTHTQYTQS